jgi:putative oxidoreductase
VTSLCLAVKECLARFPQRKAAVDLPVVDGEAADRSASEGELDVKISSIPRRSPRWRDLPIDLISGSPIARWAPVPLRLIVGYGFMEHGLAKLARGADAFPMILQALGVPAPHLMGWLTILVEIFGGLAVLLGAPVLLASIPMAAVLLVAIFTVHLPYGFSSIKLEAVTVAGAQFGPPGAETDLLYLACLAALV